MAHFEATVRLSDLTEPDEATARRDLEDRLRAAGFTRWQIIRVGYPVARTSIGAFRRRPRRPPRAFSPTPAGYAGGGLLVAAVAAWTLWFLYLLGS